MKQGRTNLVFAASTLVLSIISLLVVVQGASDEPYVAFRKSDALVQVGVAIVLMLLWGGVAVAILVGIERHRVSKWLLALVLWILICELYLFCCPYGYLQDMFHYVARSH